MFECRQCRVENFNKISKILIKFSLTLSFFHNQANHVVYNRILAAINKDNCLEFNFLKL